MSEQAIKVHCWTGNTEDAEERFGFGSPEWAEAFENPSTCMLEHGHDGPHEFISDDKIGVTFVEAHPQ